MMSQSTDMITCVPEAGIKGRESYYIPRIFSPAGLWPSCEVILTTTLGLLFISSYNLVGITITRYLSIRDPLRFPLRFTRRRALAAVMTTWCSLTLISCAIYVRGEPRKFCSNSWWRHQMETFSASLILCVGNSPVTGEFPSQRTVARSFNVFFDLRLNKRLSNS